jgi:hypothetical protein
MPYFLVCLFLSLAALPAGAESNSCSFADTIKTGADSSVPVRFDRAWLLCQKELRKYDFRYLTESGDTAFATESRQTLIRLGRLLIGWKIPDSLIAPAVKAGGKAIDVPGKNNYGGMAWTTKKPGQIAFGGLEDGAWIDWKDVNFKEPGKQAAEIIFLGLLLVILSLFLGLAKAEEDKIGTAFHVFFFLISFFILLAGLWMTVNQLLGLITVFLTNNAGCAPLLSGLLLGANAVALLVIVVLSLIKLMPYDMIAQSATIGLVKERSRLTIAAAIIEIAVIIGLLTTSILAFLFYFGAAAFVFLVIYLFPIVWKKISEARRKREQITINPAPTFSLRGKKG